jgi:hypothetical protein
MRTSLLADSSESRPVPPRTPREPSVPVSRPQRGASFESWQLDIGVHGSAPDAATLVHRAHRFEGGSLTRIVEQEPPANAEAMDAYVRACADDENDPVQMTEAVAELLNEWTLPLPHQSAIVRLLAGMAGVTEAGAAIDRLGRRGTAYLAESSTDGRFAAMLVVSAGGDRILTVETIYRGGVAELDIAPPAVVRSIAWT